jgi:formylglycine-generating enzyme required for sulfatase activity
MLRYGTLWRSWLIAVVLVMNAGVAVGLEPKLANSIGMEFVLIPSGRFLMGSPSDEPYRNTGEIQHEVTISHPFYLQTTEVTVAQWQNVMGKPWYYFFRRPKCSGNMPITRIGLYDIRKFIERLNARGEGTYRLPTEAEWEYACRAGGIMTYSWGDRIDCTRAMYANNDHGSDLCIEASRARGLPVNGPAPVQSYPPNAWGLYDMHGNVWEWCQDWFEPYDATPRKDPQGPPSGDMRVRRGGSWFSENYTLRSANRAFGHPANRLNTTGFRVVRIADES